MGDSNEWSSDWEQRGFGEYEMNRRKNAWKDDMTGVFNVYSDWKSYAELILSILIPAKTKASSPSTDFAETESSRLTLTYPMASLWPRTRFFALLGLWRSVLLDFKCTNDAIGY